LALTLQAHGAQVTVIDNLVPGCGGAMANLKGSGIRVEICDIGDSRIVPDALRGADVIFNLASEISHSADLAEARRDLELNVSSQLSFLHHCANCATGKRIVYTSTRQVYGRPQYLPVDERHPVEPVDFNGVHKQVAARYHLLMSGMGMIDAVVLNLTNVYGPRIALTIPGQGFLACFLGRALRSQPLSVYGDGSQRRDPLYVGDAVNAILSAGVAKLGGQRVFNIGHTESWSLLEIAKLVSELAGLPPPGLCPFPKERLAIDIGDYLTDTRLSASILGWQAAVHLPEGLKQTLEFYRGHEAGNSAATGGSFVENARN
ncbi:MAG: NAD-dependent epimerase/dehydratase family protein, partial [Bryobacterales bacterium]|nr:NAD-dependent epimerase/dehydratase family protein [Bryobacterales bacterium]